MTKKFINFILENKKMVLCASTIVVALIAVIIGASLLMKGDNETITKPTTISYSTTMPTSTESPTIPPIEVNKTESAEPESTSIEPGETSGGLEVTVQGGTASVPSNTGSPSAEKTTASTKTNTTTKPAAPSATAAKPITSISIISNSTKPTVTKTPTPTPTPIIKTVTQEDIDNNWFSSTGNDINEMISTAINAMSLWDSVDYRTIGEKWKKENLYYYSLFSTSVPTELDKIISNAKKYNIVSMAEFVPDIMSSVQYDGSNCFVRGTLYIKYSSLTNASYLNSIGFKADTWYSKRFDVYVKWAIDWGNAPVVWDYCETYLFSKQVALTDWKETKR